MSINVKPIGPSQVTDDPQSIIKLIREVFADLEDQLNTRAQVYSSTNGSIPTGLNQGDILVAVVQGKLQIAIKTKTDYTSLTADMIGGMLAMGTTFMGLIRKSGLPAIADFPLQNNWGFYYNTAATTLYLCYNTNNTLFKVQLT